MADRRAARIDSLLPGLAGDPSLHLHTLDLAGERALLIDADRAYYRAATFLDERALPADRAGAWVPLARVWQAFEAAPGPRAPCAFIFHLGHAGSTLLSRLLDELPGVLGLREPLALRPLALAANRLALAPEPGLAAACVRALPNVHAALARRFAGDRAVVVKATSIVSALAPQLLAQHRGDRALVLTVGLRAYLANALDKPLGEDLPGFAAHREAGLRARVAGFAHGFAGQPPARLAALSWLAEVVALAPLAADPRVRRFDFDTLLAAREATLASMLEHLGLAEGAAAALAASPVFDAYSKQPSVGFGPAARRATLARSWRANRIAIVDAEGLVESLAAQHPELARVVTAAAASAQPLEWASG